MADVQSSFTRGTLAGVYSIQFLFPYPRGLADHSPDEARTLRRLIAVCGLLKRGPHRLRKFDERDHTRCGNRRVRELGMLGLTIQRKYTVSSSHQRLTRVSFEALSSIDASLAGSVGVHCGLGAKAIVLHGSEEQKQRYLPPLARGDFLAAYALTEPDVGLDAQTSKPPLVRAKMARRGN